MNLTVPDNSIVYLDPPLGSNGYTCPSCGTWVYDYQVHQCLPVIDIPGSGTVPGYYRYWANNGKYTVSCPQCGCAGDDNHVFCTQCGIRLKIKHKCPGNIFDHLFPVGQKHCQYCGTKLSEKQ